MWFLSVVGKRCNFLTLFYIGKILPQYTSKLPCHFDITQLFSFFFSVVVLLHTVPVFYEKYKYKIDSFVEKIVAESKKKYSVFNEKVASRFSKEPLRDKKD